MHHTYETLKDEDQAGKPNKAESADSDQRKTAVSSVAEDATAQEPAKQDIPKTDRPTDNVMP